MNGPILECIPNFSEGRNPEVIRQITAAIASVRQVYLLNVDPGYGAHRTVVTFAGDPEAVIEAAFRGIRTAAEQIDMRRHRGTHPRMGATDVCPLVPISGLSEAQVLLLAQRLAARVGHELGIPVYLYEKSAQTPARSNLAVIRAGEYEGFREKITRPEWKPDFGPQVFHETAGQTVIGVRDFLVAYNFNLNTRSAKLAHAVALDIREKGRVKTEQGKTLHDASGAPLREPGMCKGLKAIGWYIEEYGIAQVSANLTDLSQTSVHAAFEAARAAAARRGLRVTGSELVGMIPLRCLRDAGRFYLDKQGLLEEAPAEELVHIAIKSLGLGELGPFDPQQKIIEYRLQTLQPPPGGELSAPPEGLL